MRECRTNPNAPPMPITVIKNARIVNEGSITEADLKIRDGRIDTIARAHRFARRRASRSMPRALF